MLFNLRSIFILKKTLGKFEKVKNVKMRLIELKRKNVFFIYGGQCRD